MFLVRKFRNTQNKGKSGDGAREQHTYAPGLIVVDFIFESERTATFEAKITTNFLWKCIGVLVIALPMSEEGMYTYKHDYHQQVI